MSTTTRFLYQDFHYADDTVIMSETEEGLQQALLNFEQYWHLWKLKVNTQKIYIITVIIVLRKKD